MLIWLTPRRRDEVLQRSSEAEMAATEKEIPGSSQPCRDAEKYNKDESGEECIRMEIELRKGPMRLLLLMNHETPPL